MVWVDCQGKTPFDSSLLGDIDYYPWRGFPSYFFPYKNEPRYMEPLIAIHLKNPRGKSNAVFTVARLKTFLLQLEL